MLDGVGPTCTSTGRASGSLSRRGSRRSRSRLSGLTRLAEASRESEVRPTTVSNVIVSSRLIPGSPTVPCASLPVMVSWIGTVTRYEDDTCAEANDEAPSTMTLAMKIDALEAGQHVECRLNGAEGVVLVRDGVAEVGEDAVAQVLRDVSFVPADDVESYSGRRRRVPAGSKFTA